MYDPPILVLARHENPLPMAPDVKVSRLLPQAKDRSHLGFLRGLFRRYLRKLDLVRLLLTGIG